MHLQSVVLCNGSLSKLIQYPLTHRYWASQVALVVNNPPANAGDIKDTGWVPGSGRSPGGGRGNPLQYSCLENPHGQGLGRLQSLGSQSQAQLK